MLIEISIHNKSTDMGYFRYKIVDSLGFFYHVFHIFFIGFSFNLTPGHKFKILFRDYRTSDGVYYHPWLYSLVDESRMLNKNIRIPHFSSLCKVCRKARRRRRRAKIYKFISFFQKKFA